MRLEANPCVAFSCEAHCCGLNEVPLLEEDAARLQLATGLPRDSFAELADGWLLLRNTGGCPFWKGRRCTVYEARPAACRTYPFVLGEEGELARDSGCPYSAAFPEPPGVRARLLDLDRRLGEERAARLP